MPLSEETIRFLIERARAMKEGGVNFTEIVNELEKGIDRLNPGMGNAERRELLLKMTDAMDLEPGERARRVAQIIEGISSYSEAGGEAARWLAARQARIGGWDHWPRPWGPRRPFLEEARDRVAAGWKHTKSAGLSIIGDKEGAYRELRHIEEMKEKRIIEGRQRDIIGELLAKRRDYARADTDEERVRIKEEIDALISQRESLGNLKNQYYSIGKSIGSAGRVVRSPFMGSIKNASSANAWQPGRAKMMDPAERSALNRARKELAQFASQIFRSRLGASDNEAKQAQVQLTNAKEYYEKTRKIIEDKISGKDDAGKNFIGSLAKVPEGDALGAIMGKLGKSPVPKDKVMAEELREAFEVYMRSKATAENMANTASAEGILQTTEAALSRHIEELKKRYKLGEVSEGILAQEKDMLMFRFRAQYKNRFMKGFAALRQFSRNMTMGAMTWGDVWLNFWYNIRDFIFGPWIWGTILVVLQWMFVGSFIQIEVPNALYFVAPIGIGALTLMFNIQGSGKPWDWLTHFVSGMLIGFSAIIMAVTIITPGDMASWESRQWFTFWFIWGGATVFLGIFSFYQTGGFLFVFQLSILILLFGWLALGPYRAVYADIIDSIRAPLRFVWDSFRSAFEDVWLLATNPQEYFARQQLKNVRTADTISLPEGVEVTTLDVEPLNPALSEQGQDPQHFTVSSEIRNSGVGDAKNIRVWVGCDSFCDNQTVEETGYQNGWASLISDGVVSLAKGATLTGATALQMGRTVIGLIAQPGSTQQNVEKTADNAVQLGGIISFPANAINKVNEKLKSIVANDTESFGLIKKGDAKVVRFPNLGSYQIDPKSKAYLITATATVYVEYEYATASSLSVQIASQDEYSRVLRDGTLNPVVARGAKTPAQISLSVGRQPLEENGNYELIVSIINTRADGHVFLTQDTPIDIRMPLSIGSHLTCGNGAVTGAVPEGKDYTEIFVRPNGYVDIKPNEFSSLFAFSCTFKAAPASETKTGLITAKLDTYRFRVQKDVKVRYSPPTGTSGLMSNNVVSNSAKAGTIASAVAKTTLTTPVMVYKDALPGGKSGDSLAVSNSLLKLETLDNEISAVEIPSAVQSQRIGVTLYDGENYAGRCLNIIKTTNDLSGIRVGGADMNDKTSSVGIYNDWAIPSTCWPDGTFSTSVESSTSTEQHTVEPIVFFPSDYPVDNTIVSWFESKATEAQIFYAAKNGGKTFRRLPVIAVKGDHDAQWYWCRGTSNCGDYDITTELAQKGYTASNNRILWMIGIGGGAYAGGTATFAGTGYKVTSNGGKYGAGDYGGTAVVGDAGIYAAIDGNCNRVKDAYFPGEAQKSSDGRTAKDKCAGWVNAGITAGVSVGALIHELGHAFGLPHPDVYGYKEGTPAFTETVMENTWDYPYVGLIDEDRAILQSSPYFGQIQSTLPSLI